MSSTRLHRAPKVWWSALTAAPLAVLLAASSLEGQESSRDWMERCEEGRRRDREVHCEVRETRMAATGSLAVDAEPNGGIRVEGWDQADVLVVARVQAHDDTEEEARRLASEIRVVAEGSTVRTDGPDTRGRRGWSVSYQIFVPRRTNLNLESTNGGLSVANVSGKLELSTTNGGISLAGVSGDVRGETVNGGLSVELDGTRWEGRGLDLETTNGGVSLAMPSGYNAHLQTSTVNGGFETDFPLTLRGRIGKRIETDLGSGGAPIRVTTTNGRIQLRQR